MHLIHEKKLHDASLIGDVPAVTVLSRNPGLDVNWTTIHQWTPLHFASYNGHVEVAKQLLAHPIINVNLKDISGRTQLPFHWVVCMDMCLWFKCF